MEFDFEENEFTSWSRETSSKFPKQWHKVYSKLVNCYYDSSNPERIIAHDEQYFYVINKSEPMPSDPHAKIFQQQIAVQNSMKSRGKEAEQNKSALHISNKYRVKFYQN